MKWDYDKVTTEQGDYWNNRPLDEQLSLLKEFYPIGMRVNLCHGLGKKAIIKDYIIHRNQLYNITIIHGDDKMESIHPTFILPNKQWYRCEKIDSLLG